MKISFVVAMGENRAIGKDGAMPWHVPADLRYFKRVTMNKPMIMGRKTFEAIGRPLPGRDNIVITRDENWRAEGVIVANDPATALRIAGEKARERGEGEVMIIGGATIYDLFMKYANRLYITELHSSFPADTYFPSIGFGWEEVSRETHEADEKNPVPYDFVVLERTSNE